MKKGVFNFLAQERVHFGIQAAEGIHAEVLQRGAQRVFVVTSKSLNRNTAAVKEALANVQQRVVGLFDECIEHTPRDTVISLTRRLRETQADLIVSIGGGTVIDTVKVALVCLAEGVDDVDAMGQWHMRVDADGTRHTPQPRMPPCRQIAVPTTLSGAEFSDLGGCTDTRNGTKQGYTGTYIGAAAVILDPSITVHTPQRLWLSTGIRAIDHAVESLCSINAQPLIDATSVRALSLLGRALTRYASEPGDLEARLDAQLGAWLASMGIRRTDYGASHGLGHALGADSGVPHGITSCVLLPTVMRWNTEACAPQLAEVAIALGDAKRPAADQLEELIARLGLPTRIGQLGIERSRLAAIAEKGMAIPWVRTNPRKIDRVEQVVQILEAAW
jgi:alcohol dehydrogenase class IV